MATVYLDNIANTQAWSHKDLEVRLDDLLFPGVRANLVKTFDPVAESDISSAINDLNMVIAHKGLLSWNTVVDYQPGSSKVEIEGPLVDSMFDSPLEFVNATYRLLPNANPVVDVMIHRVSPRVEHLGFAFRYQGRAKEEVEMSVQCRLLNFSEEIIDYGFLMRGVQGSLMDTSQSGWMHNIPGPSYGIAWAAVSNIRAGVGDDEDHYSELPNPTGLRAFNLFPAARAEGGPYIARFTASENIRIISAHVFELPPNFNWRGNGPSSTQESVFSPNN